MCEKLQTLVQRSSLHCLIMIASKALSRRSFASVRSISITARRHDGTATKDWKGRQPEEHITNRQDNLNIQADASHSGKADRAAGGQGKSQATTQEDKGGQNKQAKKDHPEAPSPVIGMNDERGGVSA